MWAYLHWRAFLQAITRLGRQPLGTLFSALVVGIALSMPAAGLLFLDNITRLAQGVSSSPEISIYLEQEVSGEQAQRVGERARVLPGVGAIEHVPREQALAQLEAAGLGDVLAGLPDNPLPEAFIITPASDDPELFTALEQELSQWDTVDHVQLDAAWVERLHALVTLGRSAVLLLALLLGLALVVVTFNTIRLQILTQRHEIDVSRLLGATAPFIRRPFYWFGALQGGLGGGVALVTVWLSVLMLREPAESLAASYGAVFGLRGPGVGDSLMILAFAAFLGWLGSAISVRRHLAEKLR